MRVITITIFSLLVSGLLILMARIWGLGQTYAPFNHTFFEGPQPYVILKIYDLSEAESALKTYPHVIFWLDVRYSRDKNLFVLSPSKDIEFLNSKREEQEKNPQVPIMIGGKLSEYRFEDIQSFYKKVPLLNDFYTRFSNSRFILNLVDNVSDAHWVLADQLKSLKPDSRTLIQSDTLILMTSVKELKPEWIYGTSVPDLVRFLTFDSMWILPTTQFKGDVFLSPFRVSKKAAFNDEVISEMKRRQKRIILGPIESEAEFQEARRHNADGYITNNLSDLLTRLNLSPAQ